MARRCLWQSHSGWVFEVGSGAFLGKKKKWLSLSVGNNKWVKNDWIVCVCVCVCGSLIVILWMCVCVCVWKNVWWSYHCKEYAGFLCKKKNLSVFGFWPAIVKKIMCSKSSVQLLGAPWQESNPGMIVKKKLYLHWAPTSDWCFPKWKRSSFSEMWTEWSNNWNCAAWPWPSSFCMEGDRTGLFSREGWMLPFWIRFFF